MVDMYTQLIIGKDDWNLDRVPLKYQQAVLAELKKRGYDANGKELPKDV